MADTIRLLSLRSSGWHRLIGPIGYPILAASMSPAPAPMLTPPPVARVNTDNAEIALLLLKKRKHVKVNRD